MKRLFRSSAAVLAVGYVVFGVVALVLFAVPLWYAWQKTVEQGRSEILSADAQRLTEVFRRSGASGLKSFVDERVGLQIPGERILLVTDPAFHPIAGNLARWPRDIPPQGGTYTVQLNLQGKPTRAVDVHVRLPGGYNVLVGRDTARYVPVEQDFWYGLAGAVAVLAIVGVLGGLLIRRILMMRIQGIQDTVAAIMQGRLGHRLETSRSGDELDTRSQTINGMLEQIEHSSTACGSLELHRARPAHAACGAALPAGGVVPHPAGAGRDVHRDRRRAGGRGPGDRDLQCAAAAGADRFGHAAFRLRAARCGEGRIRCGGVLSAGRGAEGCESHLSWQRTGADVRRSRAARAGR